MRGSWRWVRDTLTDRIRYGEARIVRLAGAALVAEANSIMNASRPQVPVDTGVLRASAVIGSPTMQTDGVMVITFGYGGPAKDYAWPQHERLDYQHRVGKAKYLEDPLVAAAATFPVRVGDHLRAAFR